MQHTVGHVPGLFASRHFVCKGRETYWWDSGQATPKYGTSPYWIFYVEGVWENSRKRKVTLTSSLPSLLQQVLKPWCKRCPPLYLEERSILYLQRQSDSEKNPYRPCSVSPASYVYLILFDLSFFYMTIHSSSNPA